MVAIISWDILMKKSEWDRRPYPCPLSSLRSYHRSWQYRELLGDPCPVGRDLRWLRRAPPLGVDAGWRTSVPRHVRLDGEKWLWKTHKERSILDNISIVSALIYSWFVNVKCMGGKRLVRNWLAHRYWKMTRHILQISKRIGSVIF